MTTTWDWKSYQVFDKFKNDVREVYGIEFITGACKMMVPYTMVLDVVAEMETSIQANGSVPSVEGKAPVPSKEDEAESDTTSTVGAMTVTSDPTQETPQA